LQELINKIPIRTMYLNPIKPSPNGILCGDTEIPNNTPDLLLAQLVRYRHPSFHGDRARSEQLIPALLLQCSWIRGPAKRDQLAEDITAPGVHSICNLFPGLDV
jgi:hypothetical protein